MLLTIYMLSINEHDTLIIHNDNKGIFLFFLTSSFKKSHIINRHHLGYINLKGNIRLIFDNDDINDKKMKI